MSVLLERVLRIGYSYLFQTPRDVLMGLSSSIPQQVEVQATDACERQGKITPVPWKHPLDLRTTSVFEVSPGRFIMQDSADEA